MRKGYLEPVFDKIQREPKRVGAKVIQSHKVWCRPSKGGNLRNRYLMLDKVRSEPI